eukprot:11330477-Prorocentrum_lima.AAC.1
MLLTDNGYPMGRTCPYEHPRNSPTRIYICGSNQHAAKDCTRPKCDPTRTSSLSSIPNKWKPNTGKGNPGQAQGSKPQ